MEKPDIIDTIGDGCTLKWKNRVLGVTRRRPSQGQAVASGGVCMAVHVVSRFGKFENIIWRQILGVWVPEKVRKLLKVVMLYPIGLSLKLQISIEKMLIL